MTEITCILLIILLAMAFVIWCQDCLLDKEKKNYEDLLAINNETLKELERKDRMLAEWEKYAPFLAAHGAFEMKEE